MIREKIPDFACSILLTHQTFNTLQKSFLAYQSGFTVRIMNKGSNKLLCP